MTPRHPTKAERRQLLAPLLRRLVELERRYRAADDESSEEWDDGAAAAYGNAATLVRRLRDRGQL